MLSSFLQNILKNFVNTAKYMSYLVWYYIDIKQGGSKMKFNYNEEFDLLEIYRKLIAPSKPMMVKANEFFESPQDNNLRKLQAIAEKFRAVTSS